MAFYRYIPNILTLLRLLISVSLLVITPLTTVFYVLYTISGISDALDGFIARKTGSTSEIGALLDSIADLVLYTVTLFRIFPRLADNVPSPIWIWVGIILLIRLSAYFVSAIKHRRFATLHTYLNKATGFILFLAPYLIHTSFFTVYCILVCIVATLASTEELFIHLKAPKYPSTQRTIIRNNDN